MDGQNKTTFAIQSQNQTNNGQMDLSHSRGLQIQNSRQGPVSDQQR